MKNQMPPVHPGEILKDELTELKMSANAFAKALGVPANRITLILKGQRGISADTALRLALYFGTSPEFWMNLQQSYDLKIAQKKIGSEIERAVIGKHILQSTKGG